MSLQPYSTERVGNFKFTAISVQTPQSGLYQKFAQAENETLIIPSDFVFPVACKTQHQAGLQLASCRNMRYCDCDVNGIKPNCRCPAGAVIFSVECSPTNKTTEVRIAFERAVVNTVCLTVCGNKNISVKLSVVLNYLTYREKTDIFLSNSTTGIPQLDWFKNFHYPDLSPL